MADRYWIGGNGNWDDTDHWSATSGGSGGESVPGESDNAYVDSQSGDGPFISFTEDTILNILSFSVIGVLVTNGYTITANSLYFVSSTLNCAGSTINVGTIEFGISGPGAGTTVNGEDSIINISNNFYCGVD